MAKNEICLGYYRLWEVFLFVTLRSLWWGPLISRKCVVLFVRWFCFRPCWQIINVCFYRVHVRYDTTFAMSSFHPVAVLWSFRWHPLTTFFFLSLISLIADGPHHYHPACGHKGSSHLSPIHALQFFYRDASSALLQLVNQWLNYCKVYALFWLSCEYYMKGVSNTFPFSPLLVLDSFPSGRDDARYPDQRCWRGYSQSRNCCRVWLKDLASLYLHVAIDTSYDIPCCRFSFQGTHTHAQFKWWKKGDWKVCRGYCDICFASYYVLYHAPYCQPRLSVLGTHFIISNCSDSRFDATLR